MTKDKQTKAGNADNKGLPAATGGASESPYASKPKTDNEIARLEEEMSRAERGMLYWSRVVGVFTAVLAVIGLFQAYAFIESERAFLVINDVGFATGGCSKRIAVGGLHES
jgi:hypothetical protein